MSKNPSFSIFGYNVAIYACFSGKSEFWGLYVGKDLTNSKSDMQVYELPGVYTGDTRSYVKWVDDQGSTDFPQFSICMRYVRCFDIKPMDKL